ncbi:DUF2624 family protein [Sediminibacillus dalangtanensis]|uniref:DUF2624 family protein n=1 Tax=Sediminibacillus dalangtanensis TaxID=2729421 RepID=A0ABX7VSC3_9BACI|nr:DUF2624 domain-containing protein [Sediminibacillus dalangtanensis]QTM99847.1 DUF2624 family protein [Sediminibacillus dalangtanensis]
MNSMLKKMVLNKLKQVSTEELLHYSKQYDIPVTKTQAEKITAYLRKAEFDPFSEKERMKLFKELAKMTNVETAQKANKLFKQLTKEYGVDSWFY